MYTIFTDKSEDFKCKITVEGSDIKKTKSRLVVEGEKYSLLFEGDIDSEGNCTIPIKRVKDVLSENETGTMRLEVISDDTFFSPWEDDFEVKTSKKVTVEFAEKDKKPLVSENKVTVNVEIPQKSTDVIKETTQLKKNSLPFKKEPIKTENSNDHAKKISELLINEGIKISNLKENINKVNKIIKQYILEQDIKINDENLSNQIIDNLKF